MLWQPQSLKQSKPVGIILKQNKNGHVNLVCSVNLVHISLFQTN